MNTQRQGDTCHIEVEPDDRVESEPHYHHGAKLVCIDDQNIHRHYIPGPPAKGRIYSVREHYQEAGIHGVLLFGIQGPKNECGLECGFLLSQFKWIHD
jgi:hypothetical protein